MRFSLLSLTALLFTADASPANIEKRACGNNCARAVIAGNFPQRPTKADCSSFLGTTVTPRTRTFTATVTAVVTGFTTLVDQTTATTVLTETSLTTLSEQTTQTNFITQTDTLTETRTVLPDVQTVEKRAASRTIPNYATACQDEVAYSTACACIGIEPFVTEAPTPSTTITVTVRETSAQTLLETSTDVATLTSVLVETRTEQETITALIPTRVTETVTTLVSLTTVTDCPPRPTFSPEVCINGLPFYCSPIESNPRAFLINYSITGSLCKTSLATFYPRTGMCFPATLDRNGPLTQVTDIGACIRSTVPCQFASTVGECSTRVYPIGSVPTPDPNRYNAVVDGGFENGEIGAAWDVNFVIVGDLSLSSKASGGAVNTGDYALRFSAPANSGTTRAPSLTMNQTISVYPGIPYELSAYVRLEGAGARCTVGLEVIYGDGLGAHETPQWLAENLLTTDGEWKRIAKTMTFVASKARFVINFSCSVNTTPDEQAIYLDDIRLVPVETGPT